MAADGNARKRTASDAMLPTPQAKHPYVDQTAAGKQLTRNSYLSGNFAPIHQTLQLTACSHIGSIPEELADGEYVRNGSNPVSNEDLGRDAHWFDGDGMLAGVSFERDMRGRIKPKFVNQYILTDIYLNAIGSKRLKRPVLPSIATLVDPLASFFWVTIVVFRTILLVILSHLPGSPQKIKKISAANTNIVYHDGRALALCESGPPLRIQLPELETVGWYDGAKAHGEPQKTNQAEDTLGGDAGLISFMREWTTAHPKIDPKTKEMLMFHSSFAPPFVQYSILPEAGSDHKVEKMLNAPVPGIGGARMMHDFGVSPTHTIIMDLPLSLDPLEQVKGKPPVNFDASKPSRFGIFPRRRPEAVQYFETDACCIFHTANSWDETDAINQVSSVNMLACRQISATIVFATGNIAPPAERKRIKTNALKKKRMPFFSKYDEVIDDTTWDRSVVLESPGDEKENLIRILPEKLEGSSPEDFEDEQCRLYYYQFDLKLATVASQWALSAIAFEFPSVHPELEMQAARFVYGCSTTDTSFGAALGKATKIDVIVKVDAETLIARGKASPPASVTGVVDRRSIFEILDKDDQEDTIRAFKMPEGWYAQEPRFVPKSSAVTEDDGYLLFYAFDESQLQQNGEVPADTSRAKAKSELWIVDAKDMKTVTARICLPQRVPYGLHGSWFSAEQIAKQRPVSTIRTTTTALTPQTPSLWMDIRDWIEARLG